MSTATLPAVIDRNGAAAIESTHYRVSDIQVMAKQVAHSRLFGMDESQMFTLMLLANSKGLHPIQAVERYHVIQGKPAMKADAMLAEFQSRGGVVEWLQHDNAKVEATFTAPNVKGPTTVAWTLDDAKKAELLKNAMWSKYPRQMLRARVISEGIRMTMPGILSGIYTPEEVADFAPEPQRTPDRITDDNLRGAAPDAHHAKNFDNATGHGSGAYAAPEVVADFKEWARQFLAAKQERWLDFASKYEGADQDARLREILGPWQLTNHLFKWGRERQMFNAPADAKQGQKPGFLAVAWEREREAIVAEAETYTQTVWAEKRAILEPDEEGDPDVDYPEPGSNG